MDRALGFGPRGCGFESCRARKYVIVRKPKSGYRLVVGRVLAKDEVGVRFSLSALRVKIRDRYEVFQNP